ncbi:MAG: hypothetical protein IPF79_06090 [Ignavibacteria bacterium]|nr:hypothetical protein [Ignavibacteria bacterium]
MTWPRENSIRDHGGGYLGYDLRHPQMGSDLDPLATLTTIAPRTTSSISVDRTCCVGVALRMISHPTRSPDSIGGCY